MGEGEGSYTIPTHLMSSNSARADSISDTDTAPDVSLRISSFSTWRISPHFSSSSATVAPSSERAVSSAPRGSSLDGPNSSSSSSKSLSEE